MYLGSKSVETLVASCAKLYECHMIIIFKTLHFLPDPLARGDHLKSFMAYLQLREIGLHKRVPKERGHMVFRLALITRVLIMNESL